MKMLNTVFSEFAYVHGGWGEQRGDQSTCIPSPCQPQEGEYVASFTLEESHVELF